MSGRRISRPEVARHLRQQRELGGSELFLTDLTAEEAVNLARGWASGPSDGSMAPPPAAEGSSVGLRRAPGSIPGGLLAPAYEELKSEALACSRCALAKSRTQVVFSDGNPGARLMVVGEAPGAQEDKTGLAFVGPAGKFLDLLLASVGLSRSETAYICNILKCRPPGNRNPLPDEIQQCTPLLRRQIEIISPEAILAVGTFSAQFLTGRDLPLGKLRGGVYSYEGVPTVVTYHPAALLRNPGWTRATWDDLQFLRQVMDGA
ncbi:uracil-DNA glycosylase [Gemmatimonadota bacterium]